MIDVRSFFNSTDTPVFRPQEDRLVSGDITALQTALAKTGRFPANSFDLRVLTPQDLDVVPRQTAAQISTDDPDAGIDNTLIQRRAAHEKRRSTFPVFKASHNTRSKRKFWAGGETLQEAALAAKVDIMITHSPAHGFIADLEADQYYIP